MRFFFPSIFLFFALSLAACGGSEGTVGSGSSTSPTSPAGDLTGDWTGSWLSASGTGGAMSGAFTQTGSDVEADFVIDGSPCFAGGHFSGTVAGDALSGTFEAGAARITMSATISPSSTNGTYESLSAGACSGDTGTFTMHR